MRGGSNIDEGREIECDGSELGVASMTEGSKLVDTVESDRVNGMLIDSSTLGNTTELEVGRTGGRLIFEENSSNRVQRI
ncbi:hypothetical protein CC2G_011111 [Coprinopsis cinerea AmutBmut pab1-1]|nr:hypothetical protein CC2G_011111 [Coprinopsis cinerea AmutBmut pab1-1]